MSSNRAAAPTLSFLAEATIAVRTLTSPALRDR
jgi:hypothetical protein